VRDVTLADAAVAVSATSTVTVAGAGSRWLTVTPPAGLASVALRVSSAGTRQRWLLPVLHSRVVRFMSHPVTAWIMFAAMMWAVHFSPLFEGSLEGPLIHDPAHGPFMEPAAIAGAVLYTLSQPRRMRTELWTMWSLAEQH